MHKDVASQSSCGAVCEGASVSIQRRDEPRTHDRGGAAEAGKPRECSPPRDVLGEGRDDEAKVARDPEEDAGVVGEAKPIHTAAIAVGAGAVMRRSAVRRSALGACTVAFEHTDRPGMAQRTDRAEVTLQALQNVRLQNISVRVLVDDERRRDVGEEDGSHRAAAVRGGEEEGHGEGRCAELERERHQFGAPAQVFQPGAAQNPVVRTCAGVLAPRSP